MVVFSGALQRRCSQKALLFPRMNMRVRRRASVIDLSW